MKRIINYIIPFVILVTAFSCSGNVHYTPSMRKAEQIMDTLPDSYKNHGTPYQKLLSYYLLGRVYSDMDHTANAIKYFNKALDVKHVDSTDIYLARTNNIWLKFHILPENSATVYGSAAEIYQSLGTLDLSEYYYKKCYEGTNIYSKIHAAALLKDLYASQKSYRNAFIYSDSCQIYTDSLQKETSIENSNLIKSLRTELSIEKENSELHIIIIEILVFAIIFIAIVIFTMRKMYVSNQKMTQKVSKIEKALKLHIRSSEDEIIKRIRELNIQIGTAYKINDELKAKMLSMQKNKEEELLEKSRNQKRFQKKLSEIFMLTEEYKIFNMKGNQDVKSKNICNENWTITYKCLDQNCDLFVNKIYAFYPKITQKELQTCCLIKLGFNNVQISNILNQSQQATTNLRTRLYKKITGKTASADELNKLIFIFPQGIV